MHDAIGRELKAGDRVLVPATITSISAGADYCNMSANTVRKRKPDDTQETLSINTAVVFRANDGDENDDGMMFEGS